LTDISQSFICDHFQIAEHLIHQWKQLESNPFTKILFKESGFIPIDMAANKPGETNEYDKKSFKSFLKESKQAFADGFDIGILPEGQLNPTPEKGLLPLFSGAYTLARMSRRPIQMMALHGINQLWHPNDGFEVGDMNVIGRDVKIRVYPGARKYESNEEFVATFTAVAGHFGKYGFDDDDMAEWLDGSKWYKMQQEQKRQLKKEEDAKLMKEVQTQREHELEQEQMDVEKQMEITKANAGLEEKTQETENAKS
jgi:1-acyl-sn-glycerol-3-phosphate acyltransferase